MSAAFLRRFGTATTIYLPVIKRGVVDFALAADWTPVAGDCRVSIDGAASANIATLPTAIAMGNTAMWAFSLSTGEMTGRKIAVTVADAATKTVEDQMFVIETYGHASAEYQADLAAANLPANLVQIDGAANATHSAGMIPADLRHIVGAVVNATLAQLGVNVVNFGGTAGSFAAGRPETNLSHIAGAAVNTATAQIGANVVSTAAGAITSTSLATDAITAAKVAAGAIDAEALAADAIAEIADGVWDEAVDGATTARQSQRLANAVLGGKLSGGGTSTETMRDLADTKDRLVASVDAAGNRTAISRDLS